MTSSHRYYWRIYRRFRLPAEAAVTGAFNIGSSYQASGKRHPIRTRMNLGASLGPRSCAWLALLAGSGSGGAEYDAQQQAHDEAQEREKAREMEQLRQQ